MDDICSIFLSNKNIYCGYDQSINTIQLLFNTHNLQYLRGLEFQIGSFIPTSKSLSKVLDDNRYSTILFIFEAQNGDYYTLLDGINKFLDMMETIVNVGNKDSMIKNWYIPYYGVWYDSNTFILSLPQGYLLDIPKLEGIQFTGYENRDFVIYHGLELSQIAYKLWLYWK